MLCVVLCVFFCLLRVLLVALFDCFPPFLFVFQARSDWDNAVRFMKKTLELEYQETTRQLKCVLFHKRKQHTAHNTAHSLTQLLTLTHCAHSLGITQGARGAKHVVAVGHVDAAVIAAARPQRHAR